ncbi:16S rRNA (uracil(1498)-N(3))-methyltransferase [Mycoplasma phocoeninasale]|uniref:Ribosomal RNA small subunit methyltransferase E n=1 Tax=Mycoplasma phocoeninasale TaxID=2726117 RepID=A0A858U3T3_9MOLU|nr:16S rRNA (uracil(1498)-N(3))-methyltransferase [Mycoplasma phocoeninasale]QJG66661.1 16S rRNA (uracil(1498)-N(3))-methyltransferase [Mycoplasma phocoeninasale]
MYKFFCNTLKDDYFILDEETIKHLKVIRIKNEPFLINYNKEFYQCKLFGLDKAKIISKLNINNEIGRELVVAIPAIKQANFEIAIQKAVELGATKIIPFISQYCDKSNFHFLENRQRLLKIIKHAAQQSFRNIIPELLELCDYKNVINYNIDLKLLSYENEKKVFIEKEDKDILIIVGPEGGFSPEEIKIAELNNVKIVALTKTILRTETALIYMLSKIV